MRMRQARADGVLEQIRAEAEPNAAVTSAVDQAGRGLDEAGSSHERVVLTTADVPVAPDG